MSIYQKFFVRGRLAYHSFLLKLTTSGVTTSWYLFHHGTDFIKYRTRQAYTTKIIIAVNYLGKKFHRRCLTGFWICLGFWICQRSEYTGVSNIPGLLTCQGSEYVRVLDIPRLYCKYARVTRGFEYAWICLNNSWISLMKPECA